MLDKFNLNLPELREPDKPACGVYFLFQDDILQYVGASINVHQRIMSHSDRKRITFNRVAFIELPPSTMLDSERAIIEHLRPPHNHQFNKQPKKRDLSIWLPRKRHQWIGIARSAKLHGECLVCYERSCGVDGFCQKHLSRIERHGSPYLSGAPVGGKRPKVPIFDFDRCKPVESVLSAMQAEWARQEAA